MAKISAHGARTHTQVKAFKAGEPDAWLILTLTTDGRILRQHVRKHASQWGTHYSRSATAIVNTKSRVDMSKVPADPTPGLFVLAKRMGYGERAA